LRLDYNGLICKESQIFCADEGLSVGVDNSTYVLSAMQASIWQWNLKRASSIYNVRTVGVDILASKTCSLAYLKAIPSKSSKNYINLGVLQGN
jgi:hypothetical protein